jgi:hypothetical protein
MGRKDTCDFPDPIDQALIQFKRNQKRANYPIKLHFDVNVDISLLVTWLPSGWVTNDSTL